MRTVEEIARDGIRAMVAWHNGNVRAPHKDAQIVAELRAKAAQLRAECKMLGIELEVREP